MSDDNESNRRTSPADRVSGHDFPGINVDRAGQNYRTRSSSSDPEPEPEPEREPEARDMRELFPFEDFWPHQEEILEEAYEALFEQDYETVVIEGPTGIGKSPINVALARAAQTTFLTTPQKKLRRQLEDDPGLRGHYSVLRARDDYSCFGEHTCATCPVNEDPDLRCSLIPEVSMSDPTYELKDQYDEVVDVLEFPPAAAGMPNCEYWSNKLRAMRDDIAVITPAYLVVDGNLPPAVSFVDRELLVIDECHALAEQAAELWAGFTISPDSVPEEAYDEIAVEIEDVEWDYGTFGPLLEHVHDYLQRFIERYAPGLDVIPSAEKTLQQRERTKDLEKAHRRKADIERLMQDVENGRPWVADVTEHRGSEQVLRLELKPVEVGKFLQNHIWNRADKFVLSTATLPYRDDPDKWLDSIGLDPERAKVISKPMPFAAENRPIITETAIAKFSNDGYEDHWPEIVETIEGLAAQYGDRKALIHTGSYDLAADLSERISVPHVLHEKDGRSDEWFINQWQESADQRLLLTPSMYEGVDLPDDMCRWQVLVKVPYGQGPRWDYKREVESDWEWYYEQAGRQLIQSVGRGVRNDEDYCDYYVLDSSFLDVFGINLEPWRSSAQAPDWFTDAIGLEPTVLDQETDRDRPETDSRSA